MKDNNNSKFIFLYIKYESAFKSIKIEKSLFNDYNNIYKDLSNFICKQNNLELKDLNPVEIHINHPKLNDIIINNKEEWDLLYECNIINECITVNKNKKILYIDYKIINNKENNDENNNNYENKIINLMNKIPQNIYYNLLIKFFIIHKEIADKFKLFFFEELIKSKLGKEINNIKESLNNILNKNNYLLKTIDFLNIFKTNINQMNLILKSKNSLNSIKSIIDDEEDDEITLHKSDINLNNNNLKRITSLGDSLIENEKLFLSENILNIDRSKYLDENNYFKKYSQQDYDDEIQILKENLISNVGNDNIKQ